MSASLSGVFNVQEFDDNGTLLVSGRLYTYAPNTTTLKTAYTDAAASVPHTYTNDGAGGQYIALNARGELPAGLFLTTGGYDLTLKRADGTLVKTYRAAGQDDTSLTLQADLANTTDATKGPALMGFNVALPYATGVGLALKALYDASGNASLATSQSGSGGGTAYASASYLSRKNITLHAWYDYLSNSTHNYTAGQPIVGHASFNDNNTIAGTVDSDHHHSFQSDYHYTCTGTIGVASSFWSQADVTAGTITELSGLKVNNPTGIGGTVGTHYGVLIGTLTRGATNNWGLYSTTKSFIGGQLWLGTSSSGPEALIEYNSNLGHVQVQPRLGFCFKVGAGSGDRKIRLGDPTTDALDATIENAAGGDLELTARTGGTYCVSSLSPLKIQAYTVATLTAAFPAASAPYARAFVTDANATTFNSIVAGGGTNKVPVFCDGANWRIG